jgi:hypothetical protein
MAAISNELLSMAQDFDVSTFAPSVVYAGRLALARSIQQQTARTVGAGPAWRTTGEVLTGQGCD